MKFKFIDIFCAFWTALPFVLLPFIFGLVIFLNTPKYKSEIEIFKKIDDLSDHIDRVENTTKNLSQQIITKDWQSKMNEHINTPHVFGRKQ